MVLCCAYYALFGISFERFVAASFANYACEKHLNSRLDGGARGHRPEQRAHRGRTAAGRARRLSARAGKPLGTGGKYESMQHNMPCDAFAFTGAVRSCERYGSGHINETYRVLTDGGDYILQKVSPHRVPRPRRADGRTSWR